ncbi:MAG: hypothetical protein ACOC3J_01540 [Gemmatimonadota bacterium]
MTRILQDQDLLLWEAYATSGEFGFPEGSRMVFQCLSDPARRARIVQREGDKSDVEGELARLSDDDLLDLLDRTEEVS